MPNLSSFLVLASIGGAFAQRASSAIYVPGGDPGDAVAFAGATLDVVATDASSHTTYLIHGGEPLPAPVTVVDGPTDATAVAIVTGEDEVVTTYSVGCTKGAGTAVCVHVEGAGTTTSTEAMLTFTFELGATLTSSTSTSSTSSTTPPASRPSSSSPSNTGSSAGTSTTTTTTPTRTGGSRTTNAAACTVVLLSMGILAALL